MQDGNILLRTYLLTQSALCTLIGSRIYIPRVPDVGVLPCISLFRRGGLSDSFIPPLQSPSFQIDCWATDSIVTEQIYSALFDCLAPLGLPDHPPVAVIIGTDTYYILSAIEETQGQTLQDIEILTRFRTLAFFKLIIQNH